MSDHNDTNQPSAANGDSNAVPGEATPESTTSSAAPDSAAAAAAATSTAGAAPVDRKRRAWLGAGLAGLGVVVAGGVFGGLRRLTGSGERALQATTHPDPAGSRVAPVSELGRANEAGYKGRNGQTLKAVPTSCLQCVAICGTIGYVDESTGKLVKIEGNPHTPNNRGMICAKGQAGPNQVYDPDRLLHPLVRTGKRGEGKWKRVTMEEALDLVAFGGEIAGKQRTGLKEIYESEHPEEFMLHYGRSRIGPALNHFVTTAFGSKTIGNHTSICETGKWLGNELTMGKHYDVNDVTNSNFIVIMGANVLEAHTSHSFFAQRLIEAKARGTRIVTFDVRLSNTAAMSNEWVPIKPGTDLAVVLAMTHVVLEEGLQDDEFIANWTNVTLDDLKAHYARYTPEWAEKESGVPAATIRRLGREFGQISPSTLITYRGFVGHYNGAYAEWAAKALDGICGNMGVRGGTLPKVSGKCRDAYADVATENPDATRSATALKIVDGEGLHLPTHHSCQWIYEMIAKGDKGRPKLYFTYCWNGAYTTGDCQRNLEVLANEEYIPFIVACDVAMSETTAMADVILPDASYLERWSIESTQSYAMEPFVQLRQPVVPPLGETMDMQDIFIQLARRIGGGMATLHPWDTAEQLCEAFIRAQDADQKKADKHFYTVDGEVLEQDPWEYLKRTGVLRQANKPSYEAHSKAAGAAGKTIDPATGTVWDPGKAHVSPEDVASKGYVGSKNAYKGYVGQCIRKGADGNWDPASAAKGFPPDKFNKTGLFEIHSVHMVGAADMVLGDINNALTDDEKGWLPGHLRSGMPCWVPVPEHRERQDGQLVMTSFKVNVQIHSRSQNCKWLQEIVHNNPAWLNPATARKLLGDDVRDGDMVEITNSMPSLAWLADRKPTQAGSITAKLHLTEGIHPDVIAVSFHCGHWAYGRYASGQGLSPELTGAEPDPDVAWWQRGVAKPGDDATKWSDLRGVHPNWIIPNTPARVSGQFRSNDTLVTIRRV